MDNTNIAKENKENNQIKTTFKELSSVNVNNKIKTKLNLSYLSWAYAWEELLKRYPEAFMTVYTRNVSSTETLTQEDKDTGITRTVVSSYNQEIPYFTDGKTCFVKVGVTIEGVEYVEYYPIMGLRNDAIRISSVTMVDVNKSIQRAFVKCCGRHGLGLYIYAGEDLPEAEKNAPVVVSNNNDFNSVQQDVINLVTKLIETNKSAEVSRYITEIFQGVRLSTTTEKDLSKLIAAREYLSSLQNDIR